MKRFSPEWQDMSDFVVHFTKEYEGKSAYDNILSILFNRVINARNPFGIARRYATSARSQSAVCFSEVPPHLISRIANKRGPFGLGFTKQLVLQKGGGPIWYAEKDSPHSKAINQLINDALRQAEPDKHPIWSIAPFIDSPGDYPQGRYRFEWEREWRYVGDFNFTEDEVAFLIIPEVAHDRARQFFKDALRKNIGPVYICPYIDAAWTLPQVEKAFATNL